MFGKSTYDIYATAKDHWFIAFLTFGEGYHNFHHRFPSDYRNGVRWYQWDPSKWTIALLEKVGLASHLCRVSDFSILYARIAAENQRAQDKIAKTTNTDEQQIQQALAVLKTQYALIRGNLSHWEIATREYKAALADRMSSKSEEIFYHANQKLERTKAQFTLAQQNWKRLRALKEADFCAQLLATAI